ncbi:MAG: BMC domain-containing protein [Fusobacteriaceae bacterium]
MNKALGLIEFSKIPQGIYHLDQINKGNFVTTLYSASVCPGKFIALIEGNLSAVSQAIEKVQKNSESLIDTFVLGNPSEELLKGVMGIKGELMPQESIAVLEGFTVASLIEAADIALKTAQVKLIQLKLARGICGKSYYIIGGNLSEVSHALESSKIFLEEKGMYLDSSVISNPSPETIRSIF